MNLGLADQVIENILQVRSDNKDVEIGRAFKPNTNSIAGSSSMRLAKNLIAQGARGESLRSRCLARRAPGTEWQRVLLRVSICRCRTRRFAVGRNFARWISTASNKLRRPFIVDTKNLLDSVVRHGHSNMLGVGCGKFTKHELRKPLHQPLVSEIHPSAIKLSTRVSNVLCRVGGLDLLFI